MGYKKKLNTANMGKNRFMTYSIPGGLKLMRIFNQKLPVFTVYPVMRADLRLKKTASTTA
jgi:hypothetical protein